MSELRKKSPRAPTMALPDAIERVEKVYAQEGRHAAPTDLVAQALGYKSASNGAAAQALASLRYYGLLERPKDGYLAVSRDYEHYKYSPEEEQKQAFLIGWLRTPGVFATLLDKYEGRLPSDANIRFDLIGMGFIPGGADAYVSAFRRSVEFTQFYEQQAEAELQQEDRSSRATGEQSPTVHGTALRTLPSAKPHAIGQALQPTHVAAEIGIPSVQQQPVATPDVIRVPVRLPKGRCAWLELPIPFFESDKERLKAYIDMQLADDSDDE